RNRYCRTTSSRTRRRVHRCNCRRSSRVNNRIRDSLRYASVVVCLIKVVHPQRDHVGAPINDRSGELPCLRVVNVIELDRTRSSKSEVCLICPFKIGNAAAAIQPRTCIAHRIIVVANTVRFNPSLINKCWGLCIRIWDSTLIVL
ncbi:MAG: hypothetical protein RL628_2004, partial [Actinomycetota bacterium]